MKLTGIQLQDLLETKALGQEHTFKPPVRRDHMTLNEMPSDFRGETT